jgi:plasmid stabilization system protein ParE
MSFQIRFTREAKEDLTRLFQFLAERDLAAARRARRAIVRGIDVLTEFPWSCRKAIADNPFVRELVIPFGGAGYVTLFEIDDKGSVTILAIRHQREDDFY